MPLKEYTCDNCGKKYERYPESINRVQTKRYCSRACRTSDGKIKTTCAMCGQEKNILKNRFKGEGNHFCNPICKNAHARGGIFITDELKEEVKKLIQEGYRTWELQELFNIGANTIYKIAHDKPVNQI